MNSAELIELAALVTTHGPRLIRGGAPLSEMSLRSYWSASKCRLNRWGLALSQYQQASEKLGDDWALAQWHALVPTMQEVLTGEILARAFTALVSGLDRRQAQREGEPVVESVLIAHQELRHRVLRLLADGPGSRSDAGVELNHLRRRCERWTDLLIGYLLETADVCQYAFEPERARDFAENIARNRLDGVAEQSWNLTLASLRAAFRVGLEAKSPNADLNARIAGCIIGCFPPEIFDSIGPLQSLWLTRMETLANDAEGLVEELLLIDAVTSR